MSFFSLHLSLLVLCGYYWLLLWESSPSVWRSGRPNYSPQTIRTATYPSAWHMYPCDNAYGSTRQRLSSILPIASSRIYIIFQSPTLSPTNNERYIYAAVLPSIHSVVAFSLFVIHIKLLSSVRTRYSNYSLRLYSQLFIIVELFTTSSEGYVG